MPGGGEEGRPKGHQRKRSDQETLRSSGWTDWDAWPNLVGTQQGGHQCSPLMQRGVSAAEPDVARALGHITGWVSGRPVLRTGHLIEQVVVVFVQIIVSIQISIGVYASQALIDKPIQVVSQQYHIEQIHHAIPVHISR